MYVHVYWCVSRISVNFQRSCDCVVANRRNDTRKPSSVRNFNRIFVCCSNFGHILLSHRNVIVSGQSSDRQKVMWIRYYLQIWWHSNLLSIASLDVYETIKTNCETKCMRRPRIVTLSKNGQSVSQTCQTDQNSTNEMSE